jgi:hypothetical protein
VRKLTKAAGRGATSGEVVRIMGVEPSSFPGQVRVRFRAGGAEDTMLVNMDATDGELKRAIRERLKLLRTTRWKAAEIRERLGEKIVV